MVDDQDSTAREIYLQASARAAPGLELSFRVGYEDLDRRHAQGRQALTPGLGLVWRPDSRATFRAFAARVVKRPYVVNRTLKPTELAGFNTLLENPDGARSDLAGLAVQYRLNPSLFVGGIFTSQILADKLNVPLEDGTDVRVDNEEERIFDFYVNWTPSDMFAVGFNVIREIYSRNERDTNSQPLRVQTWLAPLSVRYFDPNGIFAGATGTFVHQDVDNLDGSTGSFVEQRSSGDTRGVLDLFAGYRFPRWFGQVSLEINNVFDTELAFQDDSFRFSSPDRDLGPRFYPSRTILARLSLNW